MTKAQSKPVLIAGIIALLLLAVPRMQGADWKIGDLFVAVGNGEYKVFDSDGTYKSETLSDGLGGMTRSCAIDSTYHLLTTNYTNTRAIRRAIDDPHGVIGNFAGNGASFNSNSIVFDGAGNFYVGNAGGTHAVVKYNPDGTITGSFPIAGDQGNKNACGWIDLSADGNTLFYTCEGRSVKRYNVASPGQLTDFASFSGSTQLYAVLLLPPGNGTGGLLVAAEDEIWQLGSAGTIVETYDWDGEDDWRVLARDPFDPDLFWAGNPTTHHLYKFNVDGSLVAGPISVGSGVTGLCTYGGFSLAQPSPLEMSPDPSWVFPTYSFPGPSDNILTVTLNDVSVRPTISARATVIDPAVGTSDPSLGSLPCTPTAGADCVVWHLEADPDLPTIASADIKLWSPKGTQDGNTHVLRNEAFDVTVATGSIDGIGRTRTFSVYSLNQVPGTDGGCIYSSPLPSDNNFKSGQTIPVKIQCDPTAVPDMSQYKWSLNILQFIPGRVPYNATFDFTGGTPNEPDNLYRCSSSQCVINLDTSSVDAAEYLLATFAELTDASPHPEEGPPQSFNTEINVTK